MKTKRVNNDFHRLDVKLPIAVYEQVSEIAVNSFDAKVHHISNKPEITPTLLYLLELGIESFTNGNELSKKPNTDNYTDTIPINNDEVKKLIKNALTPILQRFEDLVTLQTQVEEIKTAIYRLTKTDNKPIKPDNVAVAIIEDLTDNDTDNLTDTLAVELINDTDTLTDNDTDTIKEDVNTSPIQSIEPTKDTKKEDITENSNLSESPILPLNEDLGMILPDEDLTANNSDIQVMDTKKPKIKLKDAIMDLLKKTSKGRKYTEQELATLFNRSKSVIGRNRDLLKEYFSITENPYTYTRK
jgi:hypothetical protein